MKKILTKFLYTLSRSSKLSKVAIKIKDYYKNENNCDIKTNGEGYFIEKHQENFAVVFHVCANIGEWSNYIYEINTNCEIYSFEPSKQTFEKLKSNITNEKNKIFNIGLGDKKENINFYNYNSDSTLSSINKRDSIKSGHTTEVANFDTLDNFCKENSIEKISFLKIDTEGNENKVLIGANEIISQGRIKYIQFEYGGTYIDSKIFLKDIFDFFQDKPYDIYKIMQRKLEKINEYDTELENFQYANYVAILKNDHH